MNAARRAGSLVEQQVRRWELEERQYRPGPRRPCVAFSRVPGTLGGEVAERVARELGYGLFDRQIVEEIAREAGVAERLVSGLDEQVRTAIERWVTDVFRRRGLRESDYLRGLTQAVSTLGERGAAVVLGRGAPLLLGPERSLRVLVVAPRPLRVERLAKEQGLSAEEAGKRVERADAEREEFFRVHFAACPEDPTLYDLVLNTAHLGVEAAAALVVEALGRRFLGSGEPSAPPS